MRSWSPPPSWSPDAGPAALSPSGASFPRVPGGRRRTPCCGGRCALVFAFLAAAIGSNGFTAVRLLSQALFGELVLLPRGSPRCSGGEPSGPGRRSSRSGARCCSRPTPRPTTASRRTSTFAATPSICRTGVRSAGSSGSCSSRTSRPTASGRTRSGRSAPPREQRADLVVLTGDYVQPRVGGSRQRGHRRPQSPVAERARSRRGSGPLRCAATSTSTGRTSSMAPGSRRCPARSSTRPLRGRRHALPDRAHAGA